VSAMGGGVVGVFFGGFTHAACWEWSEVRAVWQVCTLKGHTSAKNWVAFSPGGTRVVSGGGYPDNVVKIWDANSGAEASNPPSFTCVNRVCTLWFDFGFRRESRGGGFCVF